VDCRAHLWSNESEYATVVEDLATSISLGSLGNGVMGDTTVDCRAHLWSNESEYATVVEDLATSISLGSLGNGVMGDTTVDSARRDGSVGGGLSAYAPADTMNTNSTGFQ
jgi:hypothetical protein